eukprot:SAG31_NODE_1932_length_6879_cov_123.069322_1_plen_75_part_00
MRPAEAVAAKQMAGPRAHGQRSAPRLELQGVLCVAMLLAQVGTVLYMVRTAATFSISWEIFSLSLPCTHREIRG